MNVGMKLGLICLSLFFLVSGCGKISGSIRSISVHAINDFLKTEIIASNEAVADGSSELLVVIHLKNSDNSSVGDYKPEYEIIAGAGVNAGTCTTSDKNGISACILKATESGVKTLRLTNAKVGLTKDVVFKLSDRKGKVLGLASGSHQSMTTVAGHKAEMSAGDPVNGINTKTAGGYRVMMSVQGAFVSR
jgi:hypothetical protein